MAEPESIVFVVDDDPSICRSIERLIEPAGFKVQSFRSAAQFLAQGRPSSPACLVLDVRLPGLSGLDLQRELTNSGIQLPIIFITAHGDIPMTVRAMKGGAVEFLTKPFRAGQLLSAIRAALERDRTMLQHRMEVAQLHNRYDSLTPREREVLALLVTGLLNKQIAGELATTERTIKFHRANIMHKMQAESVADLVKMAQMLGLEKYGIAEPRVANASLPVLRDSRIAVPNGVSCVPFTKKTTNEAPGIFLVLRYMKNPISIDTNTCLRFLFWSRLSAYWDLLTDS